MHKITIVLEAELSEGATVQAVKKALEQSLLNLFADPNFDPEIEDRIAKAKKEEVLLCPR